MNCYHKLMTGGESGGDNGTEMKGDARLRIRASEDVGDFEETRAGAVGRGGEIRTGNFHFLRGGQKSRSPLFPGP